MAFGQEEATNALKAKDRDQYQFWQGWNAALSRLETANESAQLAATHAAHQERFEKHTQAVADFLNELYAVMVDPCAEGTIAVDEMKAALLAAAIRDRDTSEKLAATHAAIRALRDQWESEIATCDVEDCVHCLGAAFYSEELSRLLGDPAQQPTDTKDDQARVDSQ
jgi:hypothetical protein